MAQKKTKYHIEVNDTDGYYKSQINEYSDYWNYHNHLGHKHNCNCDECWPDLGTYYKTERRERRFQRLFGENTNRIEDIVGTMSYSQILDKSN
ncbi:MAG: hypothetical protein SLAVMIC_00157 [uncultured marine phage]|uniref:Uncharacterized protein n=1 Tax=uncultured marine phage TaxID=707152 RepID=A0A8D9CCK1_9VIRU|nr:MAG: hypothetical protein SLAVMIC_00157 [uncultured marine phage]